MGAHNLELLRKPSRIRWTPASEYTIAEFARLVGYSRSTIARDIRLRHLDVVEQTSKGFVVYETAVKDWLLYRKRGPLPRPAEIWLGMHR